MSFELANLQRAQYIAKTAMDEIYSFIHVGVSAQKIRGVAENAMIKLGSEGWWMRGDPALVLIGDDTANSGSFDAKAQRARCTVAENDIISVDVAPSYRGMWGDFARTFFVEDAKVTMHPQKPKSLHFSRMLELELRLHEGMMKAVCEDTTFEELYEWTSRRLKEEGFENCDYHDNFGHTIENSLEERVTIAAHSTKSICAQGRPFTYEPHIRKIGEKIAIKHEDMYYFDGGKPVRV